MSTDGHYLYTGGDTAASQPHPPGCPSEAAASRRRGLTTQAQAESEVVTES